MAEVAVAVADGDRAAAVAGWGVDLELRELLAADVRAGGVALRQDAGSFEELSAVEGRAVAVRAVFVVAVCVAVAVGLGRRGRGRGRPGSLGRSGAL